MTGPNPTPFISTTSRLALAEKKVKHLHDKTRKVPRCLVVTSLDISKIVPATLTANMTTTTNGHTTEHKDTDHIEETVYDDIEIPIWVLFQDDYEGPAHERPDCEVNDVLDAGGIFWFSVNELKVSDLRVWAGDDHRGEWLAVSSIPKSLIVRAMPFDGMVLHTSKTTEVIQARGSPEPYLWNHDNVCWDHMPGHTKHYDLADYRPYRLSKQGDKRIYDDAKIAAAITENIMTNFKRFRRANNNADARPDAAHDFEDVAARTPENMSIEVVITDPLLARHRFVLRPQDYES
ncbi:uncharacterized protein J4E88_002627 [Alternaria novae-zelandiae]|uniref:uncharacterized protein n=1 Tax=Alternaria novae-zelandiae TaxID=430562 RepID=UPI0020C3AD0F|nr:uncharacterized protein J4E88_002627 [Alternaria novae-zelandiae]KAI4689277.1 hypothetical protein J4E88_002627 [Alternaria novae-zelandiae]